MHGRVRVSEAPSAEVQAAQEKKARTYTELSRVLLQRRREGDLGSETKELIGKMLRSNPDFYTLWNYRREVLQSQCAAAGLPLAEALAQRGASKVEGAGDLLVQAELSLTADCIKKNPKSYGAWFHRQWMITYFEFDPKAELDLCALLLNADQRNFHCWNYRRFVATLSGASAQSEFEFSTLKLNENFSNYSAFHHRSVYITQLATTDAAFQHLVTTELSLVENAVYTEPDDQSAWWYRQFLLTWMMRGGGSGGVKGDPAWIRQTLQQQVELLDGLLEVEASCRWAVEAALHTVRLLKSCSAEDEALSALLVEREEAPGYEITRRGRDLKEYTV